MISPVLTGHLADITGTFRWSFGQGVSATLIVALCIGLIRGREVQGTKEIETILLFVVGCKKFEERPSRTRGAAFGLQVGGKNKIFCLKRSAP